MTDPATDPVEHDGDLDTSDDAGPAADLEEVLAAAPGIGTDLEVDSSSDDSDFGAGATGSAPTEAAEPDGGEPGGGASEPETAEPDYLADLQRVTAEFANFRKQTEKRNQELVARASSRLAEALLPVLDACDAAALQEVEGVAPIHAQLLSVLGNEGLEVIADVGEPFDPNRHEAVMTEDAGDNEDGVDGPVVSEVLRTGYAWKGHVFRPAMVKVRG